jgi:chaperonin GroES
VKRLEEEDKSVGGIIIPDSAKEKPQKGEVIAAGKRQENVNRKKARRSRSTSKLGDRILFRQQVLG